MSPVRKTRKKKPSSKPPVIKPRTPNPNRPRRDPYAMLADLFKCRTRAEASEWLRARTAEWEAHYKAGADFTYDVIVAWLRYFALQQSSTLQRFRELVS